VEQLAGAGALRRDIHFAVEGSYGHLHPGEAMKGAQELPDGSEVEIGHGGANLGLNVDCHRRHSTCCAERYAMRRLRYILS
jgi:hypothetical protein